MGELSHQFGIDWRLLIAQAVNFGALFFILYRFAYRPILAMLRERTKRIKEGIRMRDEAELKLQAAEREREAMLKKTDQESTQLIAAAEHAAKSREGTILAEAEKKRLEIIQEGKKRVEEEKRMSEELFSREAEEFIKTAVAKLVAKMPSAIDKRLAREALAEAKRTHSQP